MTTKKGIIKRLKDIDLALDQNLSKEMVKMAKEKSEQTTFIWWDGKIVRATEILEEEEIISFSFSYREKNECDSWLQVEAYIPELNKIIIIDYDAPDCFDNIEDFVDKLLSYEKEVETIRYRVKR